MSISTDAEEDDRREWGGGGDSDDPEPASRVLVMDIHTIILLRR